MYDDIEFWPLKIVVQKVGLSKTEIYRRVAENRFPASRSYNDGGMRKFWLSSEVRAWQKAVLAKNEDQPGDR